MQIQQNNRKTTPTCVPAHLSELRKRIAITETRVTTHVCMLIFRTTALPRPLAFQNLIILTCIVTPVISTSHGRNQLFLWQHGVLLSSLWLISRDKLSRYWKTKTTTTRPLLRDRLVDRLPKSAGVLTRGPLGFIYFFCLLVFYFHFIISFGKSSLSWFSMSPFRATSACRVRIILTTRYPEEHTKTATQAKPLN